MLSALALLVTVAGWLLLRLTRTGRLSVPPSTHWGAAVTSHQDAPLNLCLPPLVRPILLLARGTS